MKPLAFASATTCEKVLPAPKLLKIKDKVPLRMPSICTISSPVSSRLLRVDMTGKPAPTVPYKHIMGDVHLTVHQRCSAGTCSEQRPLCLMCMMPAAHLCMPLFLRARQVCSVEHRCQMQYISQMLSAYLLTVWLSAFLQGNCHRMECMSDLIHEVTTMIPACIPDLGPLI